MTYKIGQCSRQGNKKMSALMHYGNRNASYTFLLLFFLGQHGKYILGSLLRRFRDLICYSVLFG